MSTLNVDTVNTTDVTATTTKTDVVLDSTGSSTIEPSIPGLVHRFASAWVNFDGSGTVAIRDEFNISSVTDGGVGIYTPNFTATLSNNDYAATASCDLPADNDVSIDVENYATGSYRIRTKAGTSAIDADTVSSIIFGGS